MTSAFSTAVPTAVRRAALGVAMASAVAIPARAAEVDFEGWYRSRARLFDTLSLSRDLSSSEGLSWAVEHRLWLRPRILVSDKVALFLDFRGLDNVYWGNQPYAYVDPVEQVPVPAIFTDELTAPTSDDDERAPLLDFTLWRAWGEVHTKVGTFKFGRMPLHWGKGIWQNDGLDRELVYGTDFGDTVDRLSWEHMAGQVWVRAAADIHTEGLVNRTDDTTSFNAAAAWRTERMEAGLNFQYRRAAAEDTKFDLFTIDAAFDLEFGIVDIEGEVVGQFGSGDVSEAFTDARLASAGAVLDLGVNLEKVEIRLEGGMATGDGDPQDERIRTFTFDRDYNVGLFMFEQPMPLLSAAVAGAGDTGRSFEVVQTGNAISNALYLRPSFRYRILPGLGVEGMFLAARAARVPDALQAQDRRAYGYEIDASVRYDDLPGFELLGTFGAFIPGSYYRNYEDEVFPGFRAPAFGGQVVGRISF